VRAGRVTVVRARGHDLEHLGLQVRTRLPPAPRALDSFLPQVTQEGGMNRGPNDAELKLHRFVTAHLGVREIEELANKIVDELLRAQKGLDDAGIVAVETRYGKAMQAFIQVRRGEAFWDRRPPDPTPSGLTHE